MGEEQSTRGKARPLPTDFRLAHTYSIVARDARTGQMGIAVQSRYFAVGADVAWAEPGVGVVATQSFVDPSFGRLGLQLMRSKVEATKVLRVLLADDKGAETRQIAMLDASGNVAVHTGSECIEMAGHQIGDGYAAQANLMLADHVWTAMAEAFEEADGDLGERLMVALEAAEKRGGDLRGRQSAALVVVSGEYTGDHFADYIYNVRVDDSSNPLKELRRLMVIKRAANHAREGWRATERRDIEGVEAAFTLAEKLVPNDLEMAFWHGVCLSKLGRIDDALPHFRRAFAGREAYRDLLPRIVEAGILATDEDAIKRILAPPDQ
ncbi:MAG: DUF1028 domain-containing protein [Planctomycetota bacterium]